MKFVWRDGKARLLHQVDFSFDVLPIRLQFRVRHATIPVLSMSDDGPKFGDWRVVGRLFMIRMMGLAKGKQR